MVREIGNRVKISQIVDSQLPKFILDTISTVNETSVPTFTSGSYSRENNRVTINSINHSLAQGQKISVEYISGYGTDGYYNVVEVLDSDTFVIIDEVFGNTSGTVNYRKFNESLGQTTTINEPGSYQRFIEFLKQYYISQEYQGGVVDIIDNFNQYISLDNLVPEVIVDSTKTTSNISQDDEVISVTSTKGFPDSYGLFKIDDEIITYTYKDSSNFYGCIRGFSAITNYHSDLSFEELVFSQSDADSHFSDSVVENLSVLFLKELYNKIKYSLVPGLENSNFTEELNVGNFLKESRSLYEVKGTEESFRILFNVLFGENASVIDLEKYLIKPSDAKYIRRNVSVIETITGNPLNLKGQTIFKENDSEVSASISDIQPFTRRGKLYYKVYLFIGYDDTKTYVTGNFNVTASSKSLDNVTISKNSKSVVTVDSTIGFPSSGYFLHNGNKVFYEDKTITQFLGCSSEFGTIYILKTDNIVSSETYYGYENGDKTKKVEVRFTGVLEKIIFDKKNNSDDFNYIVGDEVLVKNLGQIIKNPEQNPSKLEIFSNSWTYNTSCRFKIESFITDSQINLYQSVDKSNLKTGDRVEILERSTENVVDGFEDVEVNFIIDSEVGLDANLSVLNGLYDIRRIQNKAKVSDSSEISIKYGNNSIVSDILNLYKEENNDNVVYIASNSLPSYEIDSFINSYTISTISDFNSFSGKYSTIEFAESVSFIDGDRVVYKTTGESIYDLNAESYYVKVVDSERKKIKLYLSKALIDTPNYVEFGQSSAILPTGEHKIILYSQKTNEIVPQKILRKFDLNPNYGEKTLTETSVGPIGMLVNGVEILGYKTTDKIYYGPIESVEILSKGTGYDVINPPQLEITSGNAKIQPVVTGSFEKVLVVPQTFSISDNIKIDVTGGNGSGAKLEPIITGYQRELIFDARKIDDGGGIDVDLETITFLTAHNFSDGQVVIYDSNGNQEIGISSYQVSNTNSGNTLINDTQYYVSIINSSTIQLYPSFNDYNSGINTIGITTIGNSGIHKFKTLEVTTLSGIFVSDSGYGYTNRKLIVKPVGVSTIFDTISFKNHGFEDGEIVNYFYENIGIETSSPISGLSTANSYYVLKLDSDSFQLADAGIGATITENYISRKIVKLESTGNGYQVFKYPDISVNISYSSPGIGTTSILNIDTTPVVRGKIEEIYVYEEGEDYGSTILNVNKSPDIVVKTGINAQLSPIIINGEIVDVQILSGGSEYYSYPDLVVISEKGKGALLKAIITNNSITGIEVLSKGSGYDTSSTVINVVPAGKNCKFNAIIRPLTLNNAFKYGKYINVGTEFYRKSSDEVSVYFNDESLQYMQLTYSSKLMEKFNDDGTLHSPIIGWSYDGHPIYGSYGYSDPDDSNSPIKKIESGYSITTIKNSPPGFGEEFFIDAFTYDNSGDLDQYNGRFCKTPEFPEGVYAYFATTKNDPYSDSMIGQFPYFIGNYYRSFYDRKSANLLSQYYDFNSSNLIRNTLPYSVNEKYADNDFIIESNEILSQKSLIESTSSGKVDGFNVINSGDNYSVGDRIIFKNEPSLVVKVSEIFGKDIDKIYTTSDEFSSSIITKINDDNIKITILPYHNLLEDDTVNLSGFSTYLVNYSGTYKVGFSTYSTLLSSTLPDSSTTGIITTFQVSYIPTQISIGSSLKIDSEEFELIDVYYEQSSLKVRRSSTGITHSSNSVVEFLPNNFIITSKSLSVSDFDSKLNDVGYFVPTESVGIGTISGITSSITSYINGTLSTKEIPTQSIYIKNHKFTTNQKVILSKRTSSNSLEVSNTSDGLPFNIPPSGESSQVLYVINKSKDYIGLVTSVGLTTESNGLFFTSYNSADNDLFKIETDYLQEKCNVTRNRSTIVTEVDHNLSENDLIRVNLIAKNNVGLSTVNIDVKFNNGLLLVDEINISSGINTVTNIITIPSHQYETGDLVYYDSSDSTASGLSTGKYFIIKVDNSNFKLSDSYINSISIPPTVVSIGDSAGGSGQTLSKINPKITVYKNNNITFNLSDPSLVGFNFKIYYDKEFNKEFISVQNSTDFVVSGVGTVGVSSDANLTINYSDSIPNTLYYNLEKSGYISTTDKSIPNYSEIKFVDSLYNGEYNIFGVGSTIFSFSLPRTPEFLNYSKEECENLNYTTTSKTSSGPIKNVRSFSIENNYSDLPNFDYILTENGSGGFVIPTSNQIGIPKEVRIVTNGFDYPSDRTLRPTAAIPNELILKNSHIIESVDVLYGGNNYLSSPDLVAIDSETLELIDGGIIKASISGSTIGSVDVEISPKRLSETPVTLKAINNSNGIFINQVQYSSSGIVTCLLVTPISGFSTNPFAVGDKIFVENIEKYSSDGDGFNSSDYGYQFFEVSSYTSTPGISKVEFNISGFTSNPGIAKTVQESFALIVNEKNYPSFKVNQIPSRFNLGEKIITINGSEFEEQNLVVKNSDSVSLRVLGTYDLSIGDVIKGKESGSEGIVNEIRTSGGKFEISAYSYERLGWHNDTGKLNELSQVIEDNDYYQNLSYSVKSKKTWDEISSPVNSLLHTSGLKNFSDTEFVSTISIGISSAIDSVLTITSDIITDNRVDSIYYFDLNVDSDISN